MLVNEDIEALLADGRRIPAASMTVVRRLASMQTIADRLLAGAVRRANDTERRLTRRAQARIAAHIVRERLAARARIVELSRPLADLLVDALAELIGQHDPDRVHAHVIRRIAGEVEALTAVHVTVAPGSLDASRRHLRDETGLADRIVVEADPALGSHDCRIRCGDRCHEVELEAWLAEMRTLLGQHIACSLDRDGMEEAR